MNRFARAGTVLSVAMLGAAIPADAKMQCKEAAVVEFVALGPAGMKIVGKSSELKASDTADSIVITVPLAKLDTGIALRNRHMREKYLHTDKYPNAELSVAKSAVGYPNVKSGQANGSLKIHGETRPVKFNYAANRNAKGYAVSGDLKLNFKDFGIEQPGYLGVTVKPDVTVTVQFNVVAP
jgi:polyisoprenoid-binding protein YceI